MRRRIGLQTDIPSPADPLQAPLVDYHPALQCFESHRMCRDLIMLDESWLKPVSLNRTGARKE